MEDGEENVKNIEVGIETRDNKSVKSKNSKENSRHSSAGSKKSENK